MTEKRFTIIYNEHSEMMQYVDNQKEKPNRWAIWNASETAQKLNKLNDENNQLKQAIAETEKIVQSTYDELTKLRCFKKNILRIKHSWDYLMEAIEYD